MPADRTVVTVQPVNDENETVEADEGYLERARGELNLNFHKAEIIDGKLVMQYDGAVGSSAKWATSRVVEMGDRVAIVAFNDSDEWAYGDGYRAFHDGMGNARLNKVLQMDGDDGAAGADVLDKIEQIFNFRPERRL